MTTRPPVTGPLAAGGLIRWNLLGASWRLIFFVSLILGAAVITAGLRYLPAGGPSTLAFDDAGSGSCVVLVHGHPV